MFAVVSLELDVLLLQELLDLLLFFRYDFLVDFGGFDALQETRIHVLLLISQEFFH